MVTVKSYTTIEQSKKLAEILPLESADMCYIQDLLAGCKYGEYKPYIGDLIPAYGQDKIRCWSLAALLSVLPSRLFDSTPKRKELYLLPDLDKSYCFYRQFAVKTKGEIYLLTEGECLVDACYEMILKLNELNLL